MACAQREQDIDESCRRTNSRDKESEMKCRRGGRESVGRLVGLLKPVASQYIPQWMREWMHCMASRECSAPSLPLFVSIGRLSSLACCMRVRPPSFQFLRSAPQFLRGHVTTTGRESVVTQHTRERPQCIPQPAGIIGRGNFKKRASKVP